MYNVQYSAVQVESHGLIHKNNTLLGAQKVVGSNVQCPMTRTQATYKVIGLGIGPQAPPTVNYAYDYLVVLTSDVNKDWTLKDEYKDKDLTLKDKDKDKDLTLKARIRTRTRTYLV